MDLPRRVYSRELKRAVMLEMDAGSSAAAAARKYQLSPKLLEKWRSDWRARGEFAFPGNGQRAETPVLDQSRKIGEDEHQAMGYVRRSRYRPAVRLSLKQILD